MPKWRALMAYDADALSYEGEARLDRHLEGCSVCMRALAEIRAFDAVAQETRQSPPAIDWSRVEPALRQEARTQSQAIRAARRRRAWMVPSVALAAAAAIAAVVLWKSESAPVTPVAPVARVSGGDSGRAEDEPLAAVGDALEGRIVALAGQPHALQGGARGLLGLGDALHEGDRIELATRQVLHATLGPDTAIALFGVATLTATVLRNDAVDLALDEGRVDSVVEPGSAFTVTAEPYAIHARGTRFRVERRDGVVTVALEEGVVEVTRSGESVARLEAPARWSSEPTAREASEDPVVAPALEPGRELALQLPALDRFVRWDIGDESLPGGAEAALLLAPGAYDVVGYDAEGTAHRTTLTLQGEGVALDERELSAVRTGPVVGYLSPEQIEATVRPSIRMLRSCYERDLRRTDPDLRGSYVLRVVVGRDGAVRRATVSTDDDLPHTLRSCLVRHASEWQFPEPVGGPVTFDLPLNLRAR